MSRVQKCLHGVTAEAVGGGGKQNSPSRISGSKSCQNNLSLMKPKEAMRNEGYHHVSNRAHSSTQNF